MVTNGTDIKLKNIMVASRIGHLDRQKWGHVIKIDKNKVPVKISALILFLILT